MLPALFHFTGQLYFFLFFFCGFFNTISHVALNGSRKRSMSGSFILNVFQQDGVRGSGKWNNVAEMTEEEAVAEQQRMFAEARARMQGGATNQKQPDSDP
ncbi:hypothetical protein Droror1_Dr00017078 [Drosera rotundifolia]